jgi:hypothetical protein
MSDERILTVIPDANVLVHGRALSELPWAELRRPTIEVLFVPPVIRELDKLKNQSGRPNKIARQLSSDVRALLTAPGRRAEIRKSAPAVTKGVELRAITTSLRDALKLDHADQALINYALLLEADGQDVLLLTDDTICGTTALEVGLPTLLLPGHWLRDPEPDEGSKENAKLKAEIKRLTGAEPKVVLGFRDNAGEPLAKLDATITRWPALSESEINALMDEVQQHCPPATSFESLAPRATNQILGSATAGSRSTHQAALLRAAFQTRSVYEPATDAEIERYKTTAYPGWFDSIRATLGTLQDKLEARTQWPTVLAIASNKGTRPATDVLLRIRAQGAFVIFDVEANRGDENDEEDADRKAHAPEHLELPLPPGPPRGRVKTIDHFDRFDPYRNFSGGAHATGIRSALLDITRFTPPPPRRLDVFYRRTGKSDWVNFMELECASWRHNQEDVAFLLKARPSRPSDVSGAIELSVHANNTSDPPLARLPVSISFVEGSTIREGLALVEQLGRAARLDPTVAV